MAFLMGAAGGATGAGTAATAGTAAGAMDSAGLAAPTAASTGATGGLGGGGLFSSLIQGLNGGSAPTAQGMLTNLMQGTVNGGAGGFGKNDSVTLVPQQQQSLTQQLMQRMQAVQSSPDLMRLLGM